MGPLVTTAFNSLSWITVLWSWLIASYAWCTTGSFLGKRMHFLKPWMSKHVFIFYLQLAWIRFSTLRVIFPLGFKGIASLLSCSRVALRSPKPFVMGFWHFTMMCLVMCQFLFLMVDFLNLHSKIFLTLLLMILTLLVLLLPFSGTPFILILDLLGWFISLLFCLLFVFAICWGVGNFLNCIF